MKRIPIYCLILILIFPGVTGQTSGKKQYRAEKLLSAPVIDGILDDEAWMNEGTWIDDFTQYEPYNGGRSSQKTEFKILFDNNNIYVAIRAFDTSPDSIVRRLTRRDNSDGDMVAIIFDSFHDLRTGFLFGISSAGVKYDQVFTNDGQTEDSSWDPNWWVKTSVNPEGWVAEMKIPFSQLRFEKKLRRYMGSAGCQGFIQEARNQLLAAHTQRCPRTYSSPGRIDRTQGDQTRKDLRYNSIRGCPGGNL